MIMLQGSCGLSIHINAAERNADASARTDLYTTNNAHLHLPGPRLAHCLFRERTLDVHSITRVYVIIRFRLSLLGNGLPVHF